MSAVLSHQPPPAPSAEASNDRSAENESLLKKFSSRQSNELVIAFAGPIGCGIASVINAVDDSLKQFGYIKIVRIKLSAFLEQAVVDGRISEPQAEGDFSEKYLRYRRLQRVGMDLRKLTENQAILAESAINSIVLDREKREGGRKAPGSAVVAPSRVAYLIDQVKRPEEVVLLRALYRNLFYLVGVTKNYDQRQHFLEDEGVKADETEGLIEIDRNENSETGQRLDKTLHLADFFIRNDTGADQKANISRFVHLIHGDKSKTPTLAEQGMYAAYAAGLRSACLSRQVGAAIASDAGEILSTGCNDVPKAGGGLYAAGGQHDYRCVHMPDSICFNDLHKRKLQTQIGDEIDRVLREQLEGDGAIVLSDVRRSKLIESIYTNTRLKDLIEFSRSVHAEMDAIVSLARSGGVGVKDAILYSTTFPCHSCARHIVAAGIKEVVYIEPYEKSMAKDLHPDAISFAFASDKQGEAKVKFLHFEGVSPRQFPHVFRAEGRKNNEGRFIPIDNGSSTRNLPEYLDNYFDFEAKAVEHFQSTLAKVPPTKPLDTNH
jgi:deoxycytidylate deaminase